MKATFVPSVSHLRRAAGPDGPIVRKRRDVVDMYDRPPVNNPNTGQQQTARGAWSVASAAWRELSPEEKSAWNRYGRSGPLYPERESVEPLNGYRLFQSAAGNLQILGLELPTTAPGLRPPEMPRKVEILPAVEGDTLRLRIEHGLSSDGFRIVVSMSPATLRSSRKADRRNGRHVRGWGAASTAPLPQSGGEVVFTGCRYHVAPGQRFGVWVRVVRTSDGMGSAEMALDFVRPEAENGGGDGGVDGAAPVNTMDVVHPVDALKAEAPKWRRHSCLRMKTREGSWRVSASHRTEAGARVRGFALADCAAGTAGARRQECLRHFGAGGAGVL